MDKTINIIFFGDVVGKPGRKLVLDYITSEKLSNNNFIAVNVENASHGFGLTESNYNDFVNAGVDVMTSGNHIWDKKDIFAYIDTADKLLRPINYHNFAPGAGSGIFEKNGVKVGVINALGKVFMDSPVSAWFLIDEEIEKIKRETPIVIIDFHAEATAEKIAFGRYCSERGVSAVFGTHTHVQTADEQIIDGKTAYITDAGSCGAADGVIGMKYSESLNRIQKGLPERFDVADGKITQLNAVSVEIDVFSGVALNIKRINFTKTMNEVEEIIMKG